MPVQDFAELLYRRRISGVPVVVSKERNVGVVREGDLIRNVEATDEHRRSWWLMLFSGESALAPDYTKIHGHSARDVMATKVITVDGETSLAEIAMVLERHRSKRVPVLKSHNLAGIVTRSNLLQALATADIRKPVSALPRNSSRSLGPI